MAEPDRARQGGILGLVAFLDEHCEAVEADLAAYYGPDDQLHRLWTGRLSFRRLAILIGQLPVESTTMTLLARTAKPADPSQPINHGRWSREMFILADIVDELRSAGWQRQGNPEAARPEPYPRPGVEKRVSPSRKRYLDRIRANGGVDLGAKPE